MTRYKYFQYSPGGNETILIENRDMKISREDYPSIANEIMDNGNLVCEQVGFIEKATLEHADGRLHMMGGEFCVNALRATAKQLNAESNKSILELECSGSNETTQLIIDNEYVKVVLNAGEITIKNNIAMVKIPGITHFVEKMEEFPSKEEQMKKMEALINEYNAELSGVDALGYIAYIELEDSVDTQALIYVIPTNTKIFETACGSGSLAVFQSCGNETLNVKQPSGYIYKMNQQADGIQLSSKVIKLDTGEIELSLK